MGIHPLTAQKATTLVGVIVANYLEQNEHLVDRVDPSIVVKIVLLDQRAQERVHRFFALQGRT
jgi:hypothetical protein